MISSSVLRTRIRRSSMVSSRSTSTLPCCRSLLTIWPKLPSEQLQCRITTDRRHFHLLRSCSSSTNRLSSNNTQLYNHQSYSYTPLLLHTAARNQEHNLSMMIIRQFATDGSSSTYEEEDDGSAPAETKKKKKKKDLRESIERLKSSNNNNNDSDGDENQQKKNEGEEGGQNNPHLDKLTEIGTSFLSTISQTWDELIASGRATDINKKIGTPTPQAADDGAPNYDNDDEAADKYEEYKGSKNIMVIDPEEHLSAWERMERRLRDAPIISDILEKSNQVYESSGAKTQVKQTKQKIQHLKEDAEEAWETSQNPWVYRASSVYDTLTAESEFATASRQLQVLDPDFTLESWKRNVVEHTLPNIMKLFLQGRITELKPWLGEAVYNRLAAEVRARKKEGVQMDTNVLAIMNAEILACEVEGGGSVNVERGDDPIILIHFMCQQIHCVRKKTKKEDGDGGSSKKMDKEGSNNIDKKIEEEEEEEDTSSRTYMDEELGDIVEGSEDDIRANSYVVAFQREYNEEKMELNWKIVDFRFNGAIAYL